MRDMKNVISKTKLMAFYIIPVNFRNLFQAPVILQMKHSPIFESTCSNLSVLAFSYFQKIHSFILKMISTIKILTCNYFVSWNKNLKTFKTLDVTSQYISSFFLGHPVHPANIARKLHFVQTTEGIAEAGGVQVWMKKEYVFFPFWPFSGRHCRINA